MTKLWHHCDIAPPYDNGPSCGHSMHSMLVECTGCGARGSAFTPRFRTTLSPLEKERIRQLKPARERRSYWPYRRYR